MSKNRKIRCLQVLTRSDWAGAQKVVYNLIYGIKEKYSDIIEVEVACGKENGLLINELKRLGVVVHIVPDLVREISPIKDLKAFFELLKIIKEGKYDVVHLHMSKVRVLGGLAAKLSGVKGIYATVHGWWHIEQYSGLKRSFLILAERFAAIFFDKIVLLCHRDLLKAKKWKIGKDSQYVIIPNALIPQPPAPKGKLRKELGIPENVKIVGNVARLDRQKNPMRFLQVAERVVQEMDDVIFVWIGGSIVEDFYARQVQQYLDERPWLKEKVKILGFRKDAIELMADFDVFLLTSDNEGMPLVLLEALNQGIPVVSTDVGCVEETISNQGFISRATEEMISSVLNILRRSNSISNNKSLNMFSQFLTSYVKLYSEG
jgi:glycosyltransferase involved in cell wall biosynthesis